MFDHFRPEVVSFDEGVSFGYPKMSQPYIFEVIQYLVVENNLN